MATLVPPVLMKSINESRWQIATDKMKRENINQVIVKTDYYWHHLLVKGVVIYRKTFYGYVCLNSAPA